MIIGLIIVLLVILLLPFIVKKVEHNLEIFLFIMGIIASVISKEFSLSFVGHILQNQLLYFITAAVLIAGFIFEFSKNAMNTGINKIITKMNFKVFVFIVLIVLGLISSMITAIVAALVLSEIISIIPKNRAVKLRFAIFGCFSIGFGAALTPIGEPLATIVVTVLQEDFFYLLQTLGMYIFPTILVVSVAGAILTGSSKINQAPKLATGDALASGTGDDEWDRDGRILDTRDKDDDGTLRGNRYVAIVSRAAKIFLFVMALEMLGAGFRPLIDNYVIHLDSRILYWINTLSAVLDNATLAAAEISPAMSTMQIQSILMGLLISGGMLIPGNIPNIICASKLGITSKEWAKIALPFGGVLLVIFFVILFVI